LGRKTPLYIDSCVCCTHTHTHKHTHTHTHTHTHACTHTRMHTHTHAHESVYHSHLTLNMRTRKRIVRPDRGLLRLSWAHVFEFTQTLITHHSSHTRIIIFWSPASSLKVSEYRCYWYSVGGKCGALHSLFLLAGGANGHSAPIEWSKLVVNKRGGKVYQAAMPIVGAKPRQENSS
jgi:hypothetical protein